MASNLSTIGFTFADEATFNDAMIRLAGEADTRLGTPTGDYAIWRSRSGAEIWFHLEADGPPTAAGRNGSGSANGAASNGSIVGLTPFFEGENETELMLTDFWQRPEDNPFEGTITGWTGRGGNEPDSYPILFDAVDFAARLDLELPMKRKVRLVAFAREIAAFDSEDSYYAAKAEGPTFAGQAFVPIGMFAAAEKGAGGIVEAGGMEAASEPSSQCLMTGRVAATRRLVNEATGQSFHWLGIDSLDATFDVVADPDVITGEIVVGGTVEVHALMFGRILD